MSDILPQSSVESKSSSYRNSKKVFDRPFLSKKDFDHANEQKRFWIRAVTLECKLRMNEPRIAEVLAFFTDAVTGVGSPAIGTIQEKYTDNGWGDISYSAVAECLKRMQAKDAIEIIRQGKELPNIYKLKGYNYSKLETCSPDSLNNLNNPTPKEDLNLQVRSTYIHDVNVSIFNNSEKHIDAEKLKGEHASAEIERICIAWALSQCDIEYVKKLMQSKQDIRGPGFLADMCSKLSKGGKSWNKVIPKKRILEFREVEKAKEFESLQPENAIDRKATEKILKALRSALEPKILIEEDDYWHV